MMQLTKSNTLNKVISFALCILLAGSLLPFLPIKAYAAGEVPGTQAYYDARWEDAKVAAGYKEVGTTYTDHTGAAATTTNAGPWELNLDWGNTCSRPWNGLAVAPTIQTTVTNAAGATVTAYEVYTAEQFRWCLVNYQSFKLMNDIDLNGYTGKTWATPATATKAWVADGNGHTIYNFFSNNDGLFGIKNNFCCKNLRVKNGYLINARAKASMFVNCSSVGTLSGCAIEDTLMQGITFAGFAQSVDYLNIDACYTSNTHLYGERCMAQIAVGAGLYGNNSAYHSYNISNTFAINGSVITSKGHCGGLVSCNYGTGTVENCFNSNVNTYGNTIVGSSGGIYHQGEHTIKNCFFTGKVEGTSSLGGVYGSIEGYGIGTVVNSNNTYTTSLVGVQNGNLSNAGGFIGSRGGIANDNLNCTDCYAAGEVGNISTNAQDNRGSIDATVAGFLGNRNNPADDGKLYDNVGLYNCFYDAQMTGMRNWATGGTNPITSDGSQSLTGDWKTRYNIKSVFTSDSAKCGTGLTSAPSSNGVGNQGTAAVNRSFTGFTDNSQWTFVDGYYPQLEVFAFPTTFTNTNWMTQDEMNNLVKACSLASVSTAKLNTWDTDYQGNALPKDTYDTVRDVVAPAPLTNGAGVDWTRCGVTGADTLATGTGATTDVFGTTKDVITVQNDPAKGWQIKDPYPGVDWLRATTTVGGQSASRAFRVCPTVGLDPGASKTINFDTVYDHADDMRMVYSTGARYSANTQDMTYGVYPDDPLEKKQYTLLGTGGLQNIAALKALYGQAGQDDNYTNINVGNMQRTSTDIKSYPAATTNAGNTLNTKIKKGSNLVNLNTTLAQKFNGNFYFTKEDAGDYEISYYWSLNDGRFLTGTKLLKTPPLPPNANLKIKKTVQGAAKDTFNFEVVLTDAQGKAVNVPAGQPAGVMVSGNKATFGLKKGQEVILTGIEAGTKATITETKHDGYSVLIKPEGAAATQGDSASVVIDSDKTVEVINNPGVELPKAGATPSILLTLGGLITLGLFPVCIGIRLKRVRERGA